MEDVEEKDGVGEPTKGEENVGGAETEALPLPLPAGARTITLGAAALPLPLVGALEVDVVAFLGGISGKKAFPSDFCAETIFGL